MRISRYLVCECGWWDEPSFGRRRFTETLYPVCPRCGRDTEDAEMVTAGVVGIFRRRLVLADGGGAK